MHLPRIAEIAPSRNLLSLGLAAFIGFAGLAAHSQAAQAAPASAAASSGTAEAQKAVTPVAGLDQTQMDNAKRIVDTAKQMGLPERAQVIAVATAMQESTLYNLASTVIPESYDYPHDGQGSDYDSVGLFQQRSSSGWGPVKDLMRPEFATRQFLKELVKLPGWEEMPLTVAAQKVQVSAYPDHYAKHEQAATEVVKALG